MESINLRGRLWLCGAEATNGSKKAANICQADVGMQSDP